MNPSFDDIVDTNTQARRAALFLHSVGEEDRDWILEQLPVDHRTVLNSFLQELVSLGLPKESVNLVPFESKPKRAIVPSQPSIGMDANLSPVAVLENAKLSTLLKVFESEYVESVVMFLNLHEWPWKESFVENFNSSKRFQLREKLKESQSPLMFGKSHSPEKLRLAMLNVVVRRVNDFKKTNLQSSDYDLSQNLSRLQLWRRRFFSDDLRRN